MPIEILHQENAQSWPEVVDRINHLMGKLDTYISQYTEQADPVLRHGQSGSNENIKLGLERLHKHALELLVEIRREDQYENSPREPISSTQYCKTSKRNAEFEETLADLRAWASREKTFGYDMTLIHEDEQGFTANDMNSAVQTIM
ncbi:hypothetical protein DID88_001993 [Monilinia fructigena]|uniref:Uncharacterized protein n=1 Tax=Monilinia fructigena TaxID=38457 RepID=A0A395IXP0_9HELO|nr:hypothetical protein DID88_001993 [Monilinia fructigena]